MRPGELDQLVRLSLGLPDPGIQVSEDPVMLAAIRASLQLDSFQAAEELRLAEVARRVVQERQAREQSTPEQSVEIEKDRPSRSVS